MPPIYWDGDAVAILDQRILPHKEKFLRCTTPEQVINAIKTMAIRGAPAVGVAGALALALGARSIETKDPREFRRKFSKLCQKVKEARPTGANLGWAVERIYSIVGGKPQGGHRRSCRNSSTTEANAILAEDIAANQQIGKWGREVVPKGAQDTHLLQRRSACHRGLWNGCRGDPGGFRGRPDDQRLFLRNEAFPPGRTADGLRTDARGNPGYSHHRQCGRKPHEPG